MTNINKRGLILGLIVFTAAFLLYAKTINFKNTGLDDDNLVHTAASEYSKPLAFFNAFGHNILFERGQTPYYRPVIADSFILDHKIAGESEAFAHFTNIFLHALSAFLCFMFLRRYLFKDLTAFLAGLMFAVHPIVIYTAAWIPGRNDSIFFIAFIFSLVFFIEYLKKESFLTLACHMFFLLLTYFIRESAISLPFLFALYFLLTRQKDQQLKFYVYLLWIASIFVFIFARKAGLHMEGAGLPFALNLTKDNLGMTFDYYGSVLFLRTVFAANFSKGIIFMGSVSFVVFAYLAFFKKTQPNLPPPPRSAPPFPSISPEIKRSAFYFLIPLFFILPTLVGERLWFQGNRAYVPLFGFIVIFFAYFEPYIESTAAALKNVRRAILVFISGLLILCAGLTFTNMNYFNGGIAFWSRVTSQSKETNITAYKFYAYALINDGRAEQAAQMMLPICRFLNFSYDETNYVLAQAFLLSGQFENAAQLYEFMISQGQMLIPQTYASLIIAYAYLNESQKASDLLEVFSQKFNASPQESAEYVNGFHGYIRNLALQNKNLALEK